MREFVERYLATSERYYRSEVAPEQLAEAAKAFQLGLIELMSQSVTGTDEHGYVRATVSLSGKLTNTYITPHAVRDLDADGIAQACQAAIAVARASAAAQLKESVGEFPERLVNADPAELVRRRRV
jgi:DNA-binding protein YbaB